MILLHTCYVDIASDLLKHLYDNKGYSSRDEYHDLLMNKGYDYNDIEFVIEYLRDELKLIQDWHSAYELKLTANGIIAAHLGFKKYLKAKQKEADWSMKVKRSTVYSNYLNVINICFTLGGIIIGVLLSNPIKDLWHRLLALF